MRELYALEFGSDGKMSTASVLQLLNELEKSIDGYVVDFFVADKIDEKKVNEEWKDIKKQER